MAMRGEGSTIPCPGCGEQHRAVYRLDGLAVLDCPSVETPGELRMRSVPRTVHSSTFVFLRGPEPTREVMENVGVNAAGELVKAESHTNRPRRTA